MSTPLSYLASDALHVWRIQTHQPEDAVGRLERSLASEEARKANAYLRETDRRRYVIAHGALREILAGYLAQAPRDLSIECAAAGKPFLVDDREERPLRFSLSHSGEWALVGVALSAEVGVDVERIDPAVSVDAVVARFFSRGEIEAFRTIGAEQRVAAFFAAWTRKEAYVKARGEGVLSRLRRFSVSVDPKRACVLFEDSADARASLGWSLYDLEIAPGYAAAVAAEGTEHRLEILDWT